MSWLEKALRYEIQLGDLDEKLDFFRTYQRYFYIGIVSIVTIFMIYYMVVEDFSIYRKESQVLRDYQDVLEDRRRRVLDKENIERELIRLKGVVEEKQQLFFTKETITEFSINTLPKLADESSIKLTLRSYKDSSQIGDYTVYPIAISGQGNFEALVQFFYTLENYPRVVKIQDLSINRQSTNPVVLSFKMTLGVYAI